MSARLALVAASVFGFLAACGGVSRTSHTVPDTGSGAAGNGAGMTADGVGGVGMAADGVGGIGMAADGVGGVGAGMAAGGVGGSSAGDAGAAGMASTPEYIGVVLASMTTDGVEEDYSVWAVFGEGSERSLDVTEECRCAHGIGLALPTAPPDAGTIELTDDAGPFATLTPSPDALRGWTITASWGVTLSDYNPVETDAWEPGSFLGVRAAGNDVHPFVAQLETSPLLTGVVPAIGPSPITLDRAQDFELSWDPAPNGQGVLLFLNQSSETTGITRCTCSAPDRTGRLTVSSSDLAGFGTDPGTVALVRSVVTTTANDNADVVLVGQVELTGMLEFR